MFIRIDPLLTYIAMAGMVACAPRAPQTRAPEPVSSPRTGVASTATTSPPRTERPRPDDSAITDAVRREIAHALGAHAQDIAVSTTAGITELTGKAPHLLASERAARVAGTVRGVRAVSNQLVVDPAPRPDATIASDIERAFLLDPSTEMHEIDTKVVQQVAKLSGTVDSWTERRVAERVAKSVRGVRAVENEIDVRYRTQRTDRDMRADVTARLDWDTLVQNGLVEVEVDGGVVHLSGQIGSAAEKRRARSHAWVTGVSRVDDSGLEVAWWLDDDALRNTAFVPKSAEAIESAIEAALLFDPRVKAFEIRPEVTAAHVTLHGTVTTHRAKRAAHQIAHHTVGVSSVDNRIEVHPATALTDERVQRNLEWAYTTNPITESTEISVDVQRGVAHLSGTVDSSIERAEAEGIALGLEGVTAVVNALEISGAEGAIVHNPYLYPFDVLTVGEYVAAQPTQDDEVVLQAIERELTWSPFVTAAEVSVTVVNGVATLRGTVDSPAERDAAIAQAYEGGAVKIVDELVVERG